MSIRLSKSLRNDLRLIGILSAAGCGVLFCSIYALIWSWWLAIPAVICFLAAFWAASRPVAIEDAPKARPNKEEENCDD